ncbi:MAG: ATP-binding protein [Anaerolineae bacterium]|jgi:PAS domain S-box-containing protein
MKEEKAGAERFAELRKRAEEALRELPASSAAGSGQTLDELSPADAQRLVHELRVHRIELEMQNEELRRAQEGLEASRDKYFDLYDLAPVGYFTLSERGLILEANLTAAGLLGVTRERLTQRPLTRFIVREDQAVYYFHRRELFESGAPQVCEIRLLRGDGAQFHARIEAVVAQDSASGAPVCRATLSDVSAQVQAREALEHSQRLEELVATRTQELETAYKELETATYAISHDLRAPLRAIKGFPQIVLDDYGPQLPTEAHTHLERVIKAAQRMSELIDGLLTFLRLGRRSMKKKTITPADLVRQVWAGMKAEWAGRDVALTVDKLPACQADPDLLELVLNNLLSNALKYTRQRERARIRVGWERRDGQNVYFVQDNGVGLDMQYAHRLFGMFERLHHDDEYEGTGIGLVIVGRIVQRHGGRVWVEAQEGQGAIFYFTLGD